MERIFICTLINLIYSRISQDFEHVVLHIDDRNTDDIKEITNATKFIVRD